MPNLKLISATDAQYSATVLKSLNDQRDLGLFCDVTIVIQDKKFRAHKIILSASSTYFHNLFAAAGQVIELNIVRAEIFEHILNYIYTSKVVRVRSDLLEELINAGKALGVRFIANLWTALSHEKSLQGLYKKTEGKGEDMPIITESFSISAEEFNQSSKTEDGADSDSDVMFVSVTDAAAKLKGQSCEVIDLDSEAEKPVKESETVAATEETNPAPPPPGVSPLQIPDSTSNNTGSAPTTPSSFNTELTSVSQTAGVHKKHISTTTDHGDVKIRLLDVSNSSPQRTLATKTTVKPKTASEIDSISTGCKVYANIGEDTYDIVPLKEDPMEGSSKSNKEKRSYMATPLKMSEENPVSESSKKAKQETEDHYEVVMDGKTFFVCTVCKRPYVCLTSLRRHFNVHSWEKKYPCNFCNKVFPLAEYRTKHEVIHTGERRYQCLLCNQMFLSYQLLSGHCKQVHNRDPSGKKQKDGTSQNLYCLLPPKTGPRKVYSWSPEEQDASFVSNDGGVYSMANSQEGAHDSQNRMANWNVYGEAGGHAQQGAPVVPSPSNNAFDFKMPETY
ncbi:transcriptional regulator Kaiso [Synchiropus splendidus]|uniref:transcriptional regulator Kaiso n=1 Tax=Synchiropus splendidus TaxID=270530 RepID=UPI00237DBE21|nr:transcriptional regulator Kaiso [Synchiropus splendidus]